MSDITPAKYARIIDLHELAARRAALGRLVCTSGGYDPLHPGHATCMVESKACGDTLAVIVNGDAFLRRKKGRAFLDLTTRCLLVSCVREVDFVVPFEREDAMDVCEALRVLTPAVFTKGGDRTDGSNIAEWSTCQKLGIEILTGIGLDKQWSSSDLLKRWSEAPEHSLRASGQ